MAIFRLAGTAGTAEVASSHPAVRQNRTLWPLRPNLTLLYASTSSGTTGLAAQPTAMLQALADLRQFRFAWLHQG